MVTVFPSSSTTSFERLFLSFSLPFLAAGFLTFNLSWVLLFFGGSLAATFLAVGLFWPYVFWVW